MPILTCIFFTFNWLTLTSEIHFVKVHSEVASCLLSRGKRKNAPLGMRLLWKYIRNVFLVYHLISPFLFCLQNYKEFEAEILDLRSEKYGLSFDIKKYTTSGWALGDENMIGIRAFKEDGCFFTNCFSSCIASISLIKSYTRITWLVRDTLSVECITIYQFNCAWKEERSSDYFHAQLNWWLVIPSTDNCPFWI